jgi:hypothetical protein
VLTNYHVVEPFITDGTAGDASAVVIRFDYKVADDGVAVQAGTEHRLAPDWLADFSPYSAQDLVEEPSADPEADELDYALLRVDAVPGEEPVGGGSRFRLCPTISAPSPRCTSFSTPTASRCRSRWTPRPSSA